MLWAIAALLLWIVLPMAVDGAITRADAADVTGPKSVFRDCAACPEMVVVPAGEFMMGSPKSEKGRDKNEGPQHKVVIERPFAVSKYEVTFAEWDTCVAERGCQHRAPDEGWGRGRQPAINVSWNDASEYVTWLSQKTGKSYRLLTEAEWEYAARAVTTASEYAPFSTGGTINYKLANYDANFVYGDGKQGIYRQKTLPVGSFKPNGFGLYDMHGNAWEWVQDCYKDSYQGAPANGSAVISDHCGLRILRGGSWNYQPAMLRSAYRYATAASVRASFFGFRVARSM